MTTSEVAEYLRLKERTVYDMAARNQIPCRRAKGKLLFSRRLIDAWIEAHTRMPDGVVQHLPAIYAGSSEPLLEWALRQSGARLATLIGGSRAGLVAIARGEAALAGVQMIDPETGAYNLPKVRALVPQGDICIDEIPDPVAGPHPAWATVQEGPRRHDAPHKAGQPNCRSDPPTRDTPVRNPRPSGRGGCQCLAVRSRPPEVNWPEPLTQCP